MVKTFECLTAMSAILDLANGLDRDKSVLTALFAFELAGDAGLEVEEQRAAFCAALLRHLGCTAYAAEEAQLAPDDIALRRRLIHSDTAKPRELMAAVAGPDAGLGGRLASALRVSLRASRLRTEWTQENCGSARLLATQLGLGAHTVRALDEVFERWDGRGGPRRLRGDAISPAARVAMAAHLTVVFWQHGGPELAREVLAARAQQALEPRLARAAAKLVASFDTRLTPERLTDVEQRLASALPSLDAQVLAETFGDFADLQLPFTRGHSRRVAAVCTRVGAALHLPAADQTALTLAAHLHDLGQVAIPTGQWLRAQWSAADHERARQHVFFAERVLRQAPPLQAAAELIVQHHERLDGSGYRAVQAPALSVAARVLSVADVYVALREERPHRRALPEPEARRVLKSLVADGRLDGHCVSAALEEPARAAWRDDAQLTPRELEVLRLVAVGKTNKEVAVALDISARTVQHHTINVYAKLGVDTRAGAALVAARRGLV